MIKNQKGLSALVIVIIIAVIIAILLIITLLVNDQEKSQPIPAPDSGTEIKLEDLEDIEILHTEPVLIPLENIPPDILEWLEITHPNLVDRYTEEGIPMEILEGLIKARNAQYEGADE